MKGTFPIHKFRELRTPFYYYDTKVLRDTLSCIRTEAARYGNYSVHYAVKANANPVSPACPHHIALYSAYGRSACHD